MLPPSLKRSFTISSKLSPSTLSSLTSTYIERAYHEYTHIFSQPSQPSSSTHRLLDIFSVPSAASEDFLSQTSLLADFLEFENNESDSFAALELTGLTQLAEEYGRSSEQYKLAAETVRAALTSALSKPSLKLALVSVPSTAFSSYSSKVQDRAAGLQGLLQPSVRQAADSACFTTQETCVNGTGECSGHGECVQANKAGQTCWVCACIATQDSKGRTQEWAGGACEKKDISGYVVSLFIFSNDL